MHWMNLAVPVEIDGRLCDRALVDHENGAELRPEESISAVRRGEEFEAVVIRDGHEEHFGTIMDFAVSHDAILASASWRTP